MIIPNRLADMPVAVHGWMWLAYGMMILVVGGLFAGVPGILACMLVAMFSFQFWTYACWRGLCLAQARETNGREE